MIEPFTLSSDSSPPPPPIVPSSLRRFIRPVGSDIAVDALDLDGVSLRPEPRHWKSCARAVMGETNGAVSAAAESTVDRIIMRA